MTGKMAKLRLNAASQRATARFQRLLGSGLGRLTSMLLVLAAGANGRSDDWLFPVEAGPVNIRNFGARGDGVTDDTAAIRRAMLVRERTHEDPLVLYFPSGVYLISGSLEWRSADGNLHPYLTFIGQSRPNTVIKLKDSAPGFSDPSNPKALVLTASYRFSDPAIRTVGGGNEAYRNSIYHLTLDVGTGNPGAIALDYIASNRGAVKDVTIRSGDGLGVAGLSMTRPWPGPCLIKDVQIEGFDYGINVSGAEYGITLEHVTLANQRLAGIRNKGNILSIRDLVARSAVPVIQNVSSIGHVVLVGGSFSGSGRASQSSAIENAGVLFARQVATTGYASAIRDKGSLVSGSVVEEFVSGRPQNLFPIAARSLGLPIEDPPAVGREEPGDWASVVAYGATPNRDNDDDGPAIQAAIDSGAATIYFPQGTYHVSDTLYLRWKVHTLFGMDSNLLLTPGALGHAAATKPLVSFTDGAQPVVTIDSLVVRGKKPGWTALEHASARTLVIQHCLLDGTAEGYIKRPGTSGALFAEDVQFSTLRLLAPQRVWARQLNVESWVETTGQNIPGILNSGGLLWILGIKTEGTGSVIETNASGRTELLGGLLYPAQRVPPTDAAFVISDSDASLIYSTSAYTARDDYTLHVKEYKKGAARILSKQDLVQRGYGSSVALFVALRPPSEERVRRTEPRRGSNPSSPGSK